MRLISTAAISAALTALAASAATPPPNVLHISSHLEHDAQASLDGAPAVVAPGYGSTNVPATAGHHVLKVTTAAGVSYQTQLDLKPATLMRWHGKGYWCVNLLDRSLDVYSKADCREEVTDAG